MALMGLKPEFSGICPILLSREQKALQSLEWKHAQGMQSMAAIVLLGSWANRRRSEEEELNSYWFTVSILLVFFWGRHIMHWMASITTSGAEWPFKIMCNFLGCKNASACALLCLWSYWLGCQGWNTQSFPPVNGALCPLWVYGRDKKAEKNADKHQPGFLSPWTNNLVLPNRDYFGAG